MATNAKLGAGNVPITLGGESRSLRPTLRAAQAISRQSGGVMGAIEAVQRLDLDAITSIIALGIGADAKDIAEDVWAQGVADLIGPVTTFLGMIANGGRPADGGEEAGDPPSA